jgi:hypothetical protein
MLSWRVRPGIMVRGFIFSVDRDQEKICNRGLRRLVVRGEADGRRPGRRERILMEFENVRMATALFGFLAVGAIALFSMIAVATWSDARRKEREAYYKNDMLKKLAESQGPGTATALELMREEARIEILKTKQGLQVGGLVTAAAGLGVLIFLRVLLGRNEGVYLSGLIPLLIGIALFASSHLVKAAD